MNLHEPNYQHLLYFWAAAREGGINKAGAVLRLSPSTISTQVRLLEEALDVKLFQRVGRGLVLTDAGRMVYRYADEIFSLGREMLGAVRGDDMDRPLRLEVGLADVVPKLIAYRMLAPALQSREGRIMIVCREDHPDALLADLATHQLDVVVLDRRVSPSEGVRVHNHLLGESGVALFATSALAARARADFPECLDGLPFLLPTPDTRLRRDVDTWFESTGVRPEVVGEFQDSALMKVFGEAGHGIFPAPEVTRDEIERQFNVETIGTLAGVVERFYAVTAERQIHHRGVQLMTEVARTDLFEPGVVDA
jgi:LysR family transcriptional activator of nhaA